MKQTDFDGHYKEFSPVAVSCSAYENQTSVSFFPNPFTTYIKVEIENSTSQNAIINVYDAYSNLVFTKNIISDLVAVQTLDLDLSRLVIGLYTIEYRSDSFSSMQKIVKN
ncbi:MAG: T9SS type A sorting domain-containing protein [Bacteroidota bacterium]